LFVIAAEKTTNGEVGDPANINGDGNEDTSITDGNASNNQNGGTDSKNVSK